MECQRIAERTGEIQESFLEELGCTPDIESQKLVVHNEPPWVLDLSEQREWLVLLQKGEQSLITQDNGTHTPDLADPVHEPRDQIQC